MLITRAFPWIRAWALEQAASTSTQNTGDWAFILNTEIDEIEEKSIARLIKATKVKFQYLSCSELFPLVSNGLQVKELETSTPNHNVLLREGITTFGDLSTINFDQIGSIRNMGTKRLEEIFDCLFRTNLYVALSTPQDSPMQEDDPSGALSNVLKLLDEETARQDVAQAIRVVQDWQEVSGEKDDFQVLSLQTVFLDSETKNSLHVAFEVLSRSFRLKETENRPLFDSLVSEKPMEIAILTLRICASKPMTLQALADDLGVTRERVRQVEAELKESFRRLALEDPRVKYLVAALKEQPAQVTHLSELATSFPHSSIPRGVHGLSDIDIAVGFEQRLWSFEGLLSKISEDAMIRMVREILLSSPELRILTVDQFLDELNKKLGAGQICYEICLSKGLFEVREGYAVPSKINIAELATLALAAIGDRADFNLLSRIVCGDGPSGGLKNILSKDPRFIRSSLTEWSLASKGGSEYTNVRTAIEEELLETAEIHIDDLVTRLTLKYGISGGSVNTAAYVWPFQTIGRIVSIAESDEVSLASPLAASRNVYSLNGALLLQIKLNTEHLRGSGTSVSKAVAVLLDMRHGESRSLNFDELGTTVNLDFKRSQMSLGSLRLVVQSLGALEGDDLFLSIGSSSRAFLRREGHQLCLADLEEFCETSFKNLNQDELLESLSELLLLDPPNTYPALLSALRFRGETSLESEIRGSIEHNAAFDFDLDLRKQSRFKVTEISDPS